MKKYKLRLIPGLLLLLGLFSQYVQAQDHHVSDDDFHANITESVESYLDGKDSFLESDLDAAIIHFELFISNLEEIGIHGVSGEGHMLWMERYPNLIEHASAITTTDSIEDARQRFRNLSEELTFVVKQFGIEGVVYQQFCPMAVDGDGASWLSNKKDVENPYTPGTMLNCGEVIEKIAS